MRLHQGYGYGQEPARLPQLPPHLRGDPVVLRGCFALQVNHDRCYLARDGYSYCWCDKDLCNRGSGAGASNAFALALVAIATRWRMWRRTS